MNVPQLRFDEFSEEWSKYELGELIIKNELGTNSLGSESNSGYSLIKMGNILRGKIDLSKIEYINQIENTENKKYLLQEGDFLFNTRNTLELVGKTTVWTRIKGSYIFNSNIMRISFNDNTNSYFMNHYFLTEKSWSTLKRISSGTTSVAAIYYKHLIKVPLRLPTLKEQQKISSFLTLLDKKIEKQREKTEKLEQYKKGMMQKIFSQDLRFKDEDGEEFPGWETKQLKEFAAKIVKKNSNSKIINVISNSAKKGLISQRSYFKKDIANELNINGYYVISKGDFVYNPRISSESPYGPVHVYELEEDGIVSPLYLCFKIRNINSKFLKHFFMSSLWYKHVYTHGDSGARHDRVSVKDAAFFEMKMQIPSLGEQKKISEFLDTLNLKYEKEKEKLMVLEEQKKGFMQGMFV